MKAQFTTSSFPISAIKEMEIRASRLKNVISLAQGKSFFSTPQPIRNAAIKALRSKQADSYSSTYGMNELRKIVCSYIHTHTGGDYNPEGEIIITAGANQAFFVTLSTLCLPGDEFILFSPSFATYARVITVLGGKPVFVHLHERSNWHPNIQEVEKKVTSKTKGIIIAHPNNPTGTVFSKEELQAITNLAVKHQCFLISDEVYLDFVYDNRPSLSLLSFSNPETKKYLIQIFSFSKLFSMCGMRLGYVAADTQVIREVIKTHDTNIVCAPSIAQYAGIAALTLGKKYTQNFKKEYAKRRDLLTDRFTQLTKLFRYQPPEGTFYAFPKLVGMNDSMQFCIDLLEKAKVAVVPGITFGPTGEGFVRFSYATSENLINAAFDRIETYAKTLKISQDS